MIIILNDLNVELIDAKPLKYYEWESIYRNSTYLEHENFIKFIKDYNISKVYYFISNCQSANVVNFYFKNQNQSFGCVIIYEKNNIVNPSYHIRYEILFWIALIILIGLGLFIIAIGSTLEYDEHEELIK